MRLLPALLVVAVVLPGAGCSLLLDSGDIDSQPQADASPSVGDAPDARRGQDAAPRPDSSGSAYSLSIAIVEVDPVTGPRVDVLNETQSMQVSCYDSCEIDVIDADRIRLQPLPVMDFINWETDSGCGPVMMDGLDLTFYAEGDCSIVANFGLPPAAR